MPLWRLGSAIAAMFALSLPALAAAAPAGLPAGKAEPQKISRNHPDSSAKTGRAQADEGMVPIGRFANMHFSDEHCSGYQVDLWRLKSSVRGTLRFCDGLADSEQPAVLEVSRYNLRDGALAFVARLSIGSHYIHGQDVPSRDVWTFQGKLGPTKLFGTITKRDLSRPDAPAETGRLALWKSRKSLAGYASEREWLRHESRSAR